MVYPRADRPSTKWGRRRGNLSIDPRKSVSCPLGVTGVRADPPVVAPDLPVSIAPVGHRVSRSALDSWEILKYGHPRVRGDPELANVRIEAREPRGGRAGLNEQVDSPPLSSPRLLERSLSSRRNSCRAYSN